MGTRTGWMRSWNNSRLAGDGIIEDDYSEASGCKKREKYGKPRFPNDKKPAEMLNGPVIIVQEGRKKDGK